jgi:hypothetical protein
MGDVRRWWEEFYKLYRDISIDEGADGEPTYAEVVSLDEISLAAIGSGGGGGANTEYLEGSTDGSISGPAIMWEDAGDTLRAVSAAKPLPVTVTGGGDATFAEQQIQTTALNTIDTSLGFVASSAQMQAALAILELLEQTLDGNEQLVSITSMSALPAGSNNIGDVDVLSVVPGVGNTSLGKAEDAIHVSGDTGVMMLGVRSDSGTVFAANGDYLPPSMTSAGAMRTDIGATGSVGLLAGANAIGSVTVSSLPIAFNSGATSATTQRVIAASDSPEVTSGAAIQTALQIMDDWDESDRAKVNIIAGQVGVAAGAGASSALTVRTVSASDSPDVTSLASAVTALQLIDNMISGSEAQVDVVTLPTSQIPAALAANGGIKVELASALDATNDSIAIDARATVGATPFRLLDVDETEDEIKGSAGAIYSLSVVNRNASVEAFLKIYDNTAAGTTVGTTTPVYVLPVKAATGAVMMFNPPMKFSTGICVAGVTGVADNSTSGAGTNDLVVSGSYK